MSVMTRIYVSNQFIKIIFIIIILNQVICCDKFVRKCCPVGKKFTTNLTCEPDGYEFSFDTGFEYCTLFGHHCLNGKVPIQYPETMIGFSENGTMNIFLYENNSTITNIEYFDYCLDKINEDTNISAIFCVPEEQQNSFAYYGKL